MTHSQHSDIYIASCTEDGGIYRYTLTEDGKLIFVDKTSFDRPMYMTIENNKMYVVLRAPFKENNESGVVTLNINEDGALSDISRCVSTKGEVACHIAVDNGDVYCANYISGSAIKLPDTLLIHSGKGPHPTRQDKAHTHYVGFTPDKKYLCAVDLGVDTIFVYNRDMTLHSKVKVPSGHGARHIVFSADGKYMFCANELKSTVSAFRYSGGEFDIIDTVSVLPKDFDEESTAAAIRMRNGKVYISNRGHNSVSEVEFENEKLSLIKTIDCGGSSPRDFDFVDKFMICTNENSNNVTVFDCENGFNETCDISLPSPLNVVYL